MVVFLFYVMVVGSVLYGVGLAIYLFGRVLGLPERHARLARGDGSTGARPALDQRSTGSTGGRRIYWSEGGTRPRQG